MELLDTVRCAVTSADVEFQIRISLQLPPGLGLDIAELQVIGTRILSKGKPIDE